MLAFGAGDSGSNPDRTTIIFDILSTTSLIKGHPSVAMCHTDPVPGGDTTIDDIVTIRAPHPDVRQ